MNQIELLKEHRKSLAEGAQATFQVPLSYSKSFIGQYTNNLGEIKSGRIIEGIASTEDKDQQGEIVVQDKMDCSYLLEKGYLNWNHSHAPEDQIGKPLEVIKLPGGPNTPNGLPATFFRALLFENMPRAEAVWTLSKALEDSKGYGEDRSLGFSVEGGVRMRQGHILMETIVRHMAATHEPVNAQAVARCVMAKSQGFSVEDSVLLDTTDDNVPHFIFKSFGQMMKSLYFVTDMEKNISLGDVGPMLLENIPQNHGSHLKHRHKRGRLNKSMSEFLDSDCAEGMDCRIGNSFRKGYHGALEHLVYCCEVEPLEAAEMLSSQIKLFKSNRSY